jgi:hypothetical protein
MKRTKYVAAILQGHTTDAAKEIAGARGNSYHTNTLNHLLKYGTLAEAAHHRAATKFTDDVLAKAMEELIDNEDKPMNESEFVAFLHEKQILQPPTDNRRFIDALKAYVEEQGCTLITRDTTTTFAIKEQTAEERVAVSHKILQMMDNTVPLRDWIFVDETVIEESPHPKCEALLKMLLSFILCCMHLCVIIVDLCTATCQSIPCNNTDSAVGCCCCHTHLATPCTC